MVCSQTALSSSHSTQFFHSQKQVHDLKREFTVKEKFYSCFQYQNYVVSFKCHLNANFTNVFSLCSILRNIEKDTIVLNKETGATFG